VAIQFIILPDGSIKQMQLVRPSGDVSLDRAAWGGITGAGPFPPLPKQFKGPYLALRFYFLYNEQTGQYTRQ
jgi:TonB family protein